MWVFVKWFYLIALSVWIGEIVFFSFVVAPSVFRAFPPSDAGRAVAAIFPTYYQIGYVCGVVLLLASVGFLISGAARTVWGVAASLSAAMLVATLYAGLAVQPRASALRLQMHAEATLPPVKDAFDRLHRTAVWLNGGVLIGGIVLSILTAARLRP